MALPNLSLLEGAIAPWRTVKYSKHLRELVKTAKDHDIPINVPFKELKDEQAKPLEREKAVEVPPPPLIPDEDITEP